MRRRSPAPFVLSLLLGLPAAALAQDTDADTDTGSSGLTPVDTDTAVEGVQPRPWDDTDPETVYATGARALTCDSVGGAGLGWLVVLLGASALRRRRRLQPGPGLAVGLAALTLAGAPAHAQDLTPGFKVQRFEPSGMASGFVSIHTARQLRQKKVSAEAFFNYGYLPFLRAQRISSAYVVQDAVIPHLGGADLRIGVGATDWLEVVVGMPVVEVMALRSGYSLFRSESRINPVGIGDPYLQLRFVANPESKFIGVAITPFVKVPVGTRRLFLTDGTVAFGARVALSGQASIVHLAANAGYMVKVGSDLLGPHVAIEDEIPFGVGIGFQIIPDVMRLNLELSGAAIVGPRRAELPPSPVQEALHTPLESNVNLLINIPSGFALTLGGGPGITPAPGVPSVRAFLGLGYVPVIDGDRDGDGILNRLDACPDVAEDVDDFEDLDGCPEDDNDRDGILDADDACPLAAEDTDDFEDDDGCPDPDNDQDRILDTADLCPLDPEDRDDFEDDDGCPDPDNDRDGILDVDDACPDDPEDLDGISDADGCPDFELDADGDGLLDEVDVCPQVPEDVDGFMDQDGCPDTDNDGDGILDVDDACPLVAEVVNGVDDEDGCPDVAKARLTADKIEITETVLFVTGKPVVMPESYEVLDAVVAVLEQNPQIGRLRIEGHTDSQGAASYNQDLSERRALAVRQYLNDAGISPSRLLATGLGEDYPIAPNSTAEGRAINRRVEFMVVADAPGTQVTPPAE